MMTPLGTIFRPGSKPPKIDEHSLFTSIQVSVAILEGDLQIYEPWRRKRNRPKQCHVTLYANETSPFLVWHKLEKGKNTNGKPTSSETPATSVSKPRCVISVSRAKLAKTTGGSFEMTDFASNLTFRFIAQTIREAELWVEKLAEESLREANLDMRSICSSSSSFSSSTSSFPSPVATPSDSNRRFFSSSERSVVNHRKSASFSDATGAIMQLLERNEMQVGELRSPAIGRLAEDSEDLVQNEDSFAVKSTSEHIAASRLGHIRSSSKTFPRSQNSKISAARRQQQQHHIRAQPHLRLNMVLDKHRPELRNVVTDIPRPSKVKTTPSRSSELPFSEFFVHVPDT